jgi:hypothetical protein
MKKFAFVVLITMAGWGIVALSGHHQSLVDGIKMEQFNAGYDKAITENREAYDRSNQKFNKARAAYKAPAPSDRDDALVRLGIMREYEDGLH